MQCKQKKLIKTENKKLQDSLQNIDTANNARTWHYISYGGQGNNLPPDQGNHFNTDQVVQYSN